MQPLPLAQGPLTPHLYQPGARRPVRAKRSSLGAAQQVLPHSHAWAQVAFSLGGVVRLTADHGTYLVPPSRALWIPPGVEHAITVLEDTTLLTLYLHQPGHCGPGVAHSDAGPWQQCRVLEVSDLLRAAVLQMDSRPDATAPVALTSAQQAREALLSDLVQDELRRARPVRLGIPLPRDKRLRSLCEAVIAQPARHATLEDWAVDVGASPRTLARLFRQQLATSFGQWRQQVLLAQALALAARGRPMALIATELGYASASAFTAMVRRTVGQPPSRFFASAAVPA
jgi:AraC-like DNA-binding protein/mannose-6-phosphate isomerase-like protein (cupin superfamily)